MGAWVAALVSGTVLWSVASFSIGGREPWDAPGYWTLWYPLALIISGALGSFYPERPWRWPIGLMLVQLPVMMFITGSDAGLLPLGALLLFVLSVPGMVTAFIGAAARRMRGTTGP